MNPLPFLSGYRTYIAAVLAALVAAEKILDFLPPNVEDAILAFAAALGLYGLRAAIANGNGKNGDGK